MPAVVEDVLRQCSVPAGGPVRIRWVSDEHARRPGIPRRQATVWEQPDMPHDRAERARVIAGSLRRMAEMAEALDRPSAAGPGADGRCAHGGAADHHVGWELRSGHLIR